VSEFDLKIFEILGVISITFANELFRGDALLAGFDHDRGAMGVIGADEGAIVSAHFLKAIPEVGLQVFDQVANVNVAIGVGERASHQDITAGLCGHFKDLPKKGSLQDPFGRLFKIHGSRA
jgi:hypothetical protein